MLSDNCKGAVLASAVAALFASGAAVAQAAPEHKDEGKVKCAGINECKGKSACSGKGNTCAGQNSCKGKGWLETKSEKECKEKGGTVLK